MNTLVIQMRRKNFGTDTVCFIFFSLSFNLPNSYADQVACSTGYPSSSSCTTSRIAANQSLYREVFAEIRKVSMGLDGAGESPRLRQAASELLTELFARGQRRGEISKSHPADVLATAYDSLLSGAVIQWLHDRRKGTLPGLLEALAEIFLNGAMPKR